MTPRWGRWRIRLTVPGMAVAAAVALLAPPALESRDRLPVGILAGALTLIVLNGLWARARFVGSLDVRTDRTGTSWSPVAMTVSVDGPTAAAHEVALVSVTGLHAVAVRPGRSATLTVPGLPTGVYDHVVVEVSTAAPFGLVAVGRRAVLDLRRPMTLCPPPSTVDPETWAAISAGSQTEDDDIVGLRERRSGDQLRDLDWAAMARTGRLIVRQRDRHSPAACHLVVESEGPSARELNGALHRAHGIGRRLLADGRVVSVTLRTRAPAGPTPPDPDRAITGHDPATGTTHTHTVTAPDQLMSVLASAAPGPVLHPDEPYVLCTPDQIRTRTLS